MNERLEEQPCILIGGDDHQTSRALRRILSSRAHLVWAHDGDQLLRLACSDPRPNLIFLDLKAKELEGYELCRKLTSTEATGAIPVLLIRGARVKEKPAIVFESGARDYVSRPLDEATVIARVETHLELQRIRTLTATALSLDMLTEVPDRRSVEEFLEMEWGRAAREATPLSLILLRVDHFKSLVEHRGRQAGDDCLRQIAEELTSSVRRPMDFLGRYSEDTFAIVLPVTEAHGATYLAERMCEQVEFLEIPHPGSETSGHVTISGGVSTILPYPGSSPTPLIDAAVQGLDLAAGEGGNRVHPIVPVME